MAYTVPRVEIEQQFIATPLFANNPLAAFIFGPGYRPLRYSVAGEKSWTLIGNYDASAGIALTAYPWLVSNSTAKVDISKKADGTWAHITSYVESAFAPYFSCFTTSPTLVKGTLAQTVGTGTVTIGAGADTVVGIGTTFISQLQVGSTVYNTGGTLAGTIASISSNTAATLTANGAVAIAGTTFKFSSEHQAAPITPGSNTRYTTNQVKAVNLSFAPGVNPSTGAVYTRSTYLSGRDVQVGDWVAVTGKNNATGADSTASFITIFTKVLAVVADSTGKYNILQTSQRIFDLARANSGASAVLISPDSASPPTIALYLNKNQAMPSGFVLSTSTTTQIAIAAAAAAGNVAKLYDPLLVDANGAQVALVIGLPASGASAYVPAVVYASYRVLRTDSSTQITSLSDISQVEAVLGVVSPENPLAEGVYDALLNSSGTPVYYMGVPTDDLAGYNAVLEQAKRSDKIYGLVPLTFDRTIIDAAKAHTETMSTAAEARWRKLWISLDPVTSGILAGYDKVSVGTNWTVGTAVVDPETGAAGNVYVVVAPASGSTDPALLTNGARAGDSLRVFTDGTTTSTYTDYVIATVRSQNELLVAVATPITGTGTRAVQIIRTYSNDEQVTMLSAAAGNSRRVNFVFPHTVKTAGVVKEGFFVAAALAGLRAGSLPHQPLTNVELLGFDDFTVSFVNFTPTQLNNLASQGTWIVTQDVIGGTPYIRHQLSTLGYSNVGDDPKFSEDSITTNVDSVSYGLQRALSPFVGKYNVNPASLALVKDSVIRQLQYQMLAAANTSAGPQLLGYSILELGKSPLFKDRITARVELELPYPINRVTITVVVP